MLNWDLQEVIEKSQNYDIKIDIVTTKKILEPEIYVPPGQYMELIIALSVGCGTTHEIFNRIEYFRDIYPELQWSLKHKNKYWYISTKIDSLVDGGAVVDEITGPEYILVNEGDFIPQPQ